MQDLNDILLSLEDSPKDIYVDGISILLRLLDNIIKDPVNQRFRTINMNNEIIKKKLSPLNGIDKLLLKIGFEESDKGYALPANVLIAKLKECRDLIANKMQKVQFQPQATIPKETVQENVPENVQPAKQEKPLEPLDYSPERPFDERITFPRVLLAKNKPLFKSMEDHSDLVMQYNDQKLQKLAREKIVPLNRLSLIAREKFHDMQKANLKTTKTNNKQQQDQQTSYEDLLLVELLNWFQSEFFEWVNIMPCQVCGNDGTQQPHNTNQPSTSSQQLSRREIITRIENGIKVEVNFCCGKETKFYRYNDVSKLLRTRKGRCGEFANCFTFLCIALGYDARFIFSQFDHVWTEVYSHSQKRWLHVDPSENVIDSPLMYQHGWKRDIDYIVAFALDDVQDVTWRYTNKHKSTLRERCYCTEEEFLNVILALRRKRQINISTARKEYLLKRNLIELTRLLEQRMPTEEEKNGRSSGSLSWRLRRGETYNAFIFNDLTDDEKFLKQFNLRYSCAEDKYERYIIDENNTEKVVWTSHGWDKYCYSTKNIFRKVENDWKMVYLAREEGTGDGQITWKFNFGSLNVKDHSLKFETKVFQNAYIDWYTKKDGLNGLTISANLTGNSSGIGWQYTQLFRQSTKSKEFPFILNVVFE